MREGDRFDRYVIEALLGRGGMGEVYRAYDERLRRRVALKLLRPEGGAGPEAMLREARAAAALRHPNAVAVYDVAESAGRPYLTMELLEGRPLRSLIGAEGVPLGARLRWLRQAAAVLCEAHRLGLVHRDVKPDNMFVCDDGTLKLLDFGIAKQLQPESPPSARRPAAPGAEGVVSEILGTPLYMAPEHRLGMRADGRSDQFAWGVVAFELCAGRHPRELGEGRRARLGGALAAAGLGPALAPIVLRAFSPTPEARFASMAELLSAWDAALLVESHDVRPSAQVPMAGAIGATPAVGATPPGTPPAPHAAPPASGAEAGSWPGKLRRSASDAELAVLLASLLVALGLGATVFALERGGGGGGRAAGSASAAAPAAGSAGRAGAWGCALEGPEHAIAEGVGAGRATSLVTLGERVYAYAEVEGAPGGAPVGRASRLLDGRFQPVEISRLPGIPPSAPGALTAIGGWPAFFAHNGRAFGVSGFDPAPGESPGRYALAPGLEIESYALAERGRLSAFAALGYRAVEGGRGPAGKVALTRRGCAPQTFDFETDRVLSEPVADAGPLRLAAPLVALADDKLAVALLRTDMRAALTLVEFGAECGLSRFGPQATVPFALRAAIAFHRGELHWATLGGTHLLVVGGPAGRLASLPAEAAEHPIALASNDEALALAWVDAGERAMVAGFRPGDARPVPLTLAEGAGLRDVRVRPLPGGAFVTWVKGASMRGREVRCGAR
ncbi:MAG TPA: serine/threonine-protein kinase [Polyangiaceae bacterium]|nr:serine/threonine-protein kinase [Polyangiaceae bacterium]